MTILSRYQQLHERSAQLAERARSQFPSGITHDARHSAVFPLYVEHSAGARKWDADENELIDYVTGHGALLLGHGHPAVVAAVQTQMARGTHPGAEHGLAIRWAELVQSLYPGIERIRFTASGTEATMLALRLARAYTGKPIVIRFFGHYHGWHDLLTRDSTEDMPSGVPDAVLASTVVLPLDVDVVAATLAARDDIAAIILEPTGASYGMVPFGDQQLRELRQLASAHGVVLIADEVVTGFRIAPGGVQQRAGVRADLTTLAKILAGGLPGGAVGGRTEIMRHLEFGDTDWNKHHKIRHNGTFNANPLSAAAGIATLELISDGTAGEHALHMSNRLIAAMNAVLQAHNLAGWAAYGNGSVFHLVAGCPEAFPAGQLPETVSAATLKQGGNPALLAMLRLALVNHGVDFMRGRSGFLSIAHTTTDVEATVSAFDAAIADMAAEGLL
jgi:glutamate-1-semialdehyde 2,1-aminomutase